MKPLERIRQQFQRIAQGDLSQPIEALGRNCGWCRYCARCGTSLRESRGTIAPEATISGAARRKFLPVITISSRTEEQAAALEGNCRQHGTAYRSGEMNAEHARRAASQLADAASLTAGKGGTGFRCGRNNERYFR